MSVPQTYGASLYDLAKDEGMSREILLELEGIVSLFNEHPAYVKVTFGKAYCTSHRGMF